MATFCFHFWPFGHFFGHLDIFCKIGDVEKLQKMQKWPNIWPTWPLFWPKLATKNGLKWFQSGPKLAQNGCFCNDFGPFLELFALTWPETHFLFNFNAKKKKKKINNLRKKVAIWPKHYFCKILVWTKSASSLFVSREKRKPFYEERII